MFDNLARLIKHLWNVFLSWLNPNRRKPTGIVAEAEEALQDWKQAKNALNYADNEMIDYAIHHLNATEKRFIGLLYKAREAGLKAWELNEMENGNSVT